MTGDALEAAAGSGWRIERTPKGETAPPPRGPSPTPATTAKYAAVPDAMKRERRWVNWKYQIRDGKRTKILHTPGKGQASTTDPSTWRTYEECSHAEQFYDGIGFVLGDGWLGIDWDDVRDPKTGEWLPGIEEEIKSVGSYAELSPSGRGAHVIARGVKPGTNCRRGGLEMYDDGRYFTVTGNHIPGTPREVREPAPGSIEALYAKISTPKEQEPREQPRREPTATPPVDLADEEVIALCQKARNSATFNALWNGSTAGYPSASEADQALCNLLCFYTRDPSQIARLMRQSGLYRQKMDRDDYLQRTITTALQGVRETYTPKQERPRPRGKQKRTGNEQEPEEEQPKKLKSHVVTEAGIWIDVITGDQQFLFAGIENGEVVFRESVTDEHGEEVYPRPLDRHADSGDLVHIVGLPRKEALEAAALLSPQELSEMVQAHLYRYVDVKPHERELLTWYAIYTWFYRKSATSPYLRFLADTGKGKSRLVRATGDLCFLPITAGGSSTRSGIMRFKEKWQGTLLIDESDLSGGAEDPLIKYLNLGFERGQYFILSDKNDPKQQEFYDPFGPKVIGMRQPFGDVATEGRCLSITPCETERRDIPVDLGREYHEAVQQVLAHIARFVLAHWNEIDGETLMDCSDIDVEPRLKQMLRPLSIVLQLYPDGEERFRQYMLDRQKEVKRQRALSWEGSVFNLVYSLATGDTTPDEERYRQYYDLTEHLQAVTPAMVGDLLRVSPRSVTTALTGIGFESDRRTIELCDVARATGDGKREVVGTRQVRCYTVPSPQVWREITRRYYFDPDDPNGDAPPCPEILRGRQWVTLAQERLGGGEL